MRQRSRPPATGSVHTVPLPVLMQSHLTWKLHLYLCGYTPAFPYALMFYNHPPPCLPRPAGPSPASKDTPHPQTPSAQQN